MSDHGEENRSGSCTKKIVMLIVGMVVFLAIGALVVVVVMYLREDKNKVSGNESAPSTTETKLKGSSERIGGTAESSLLGAEPEEIGLRSSKKRISLDLRDGSEQANRSSLVSPQAAKATA